MAVTVLSSCAVISVRRCRKDGWEGIRSEKLHLILTLGRETPVSDSPFPLLVLRYDGRVPAPHRTFLDA